VQRRQIGTKIQAHFVEDSADTAKGRAEIGIDARVTGAGLRMRDAKGWSADKAKDPPSVKSRIQIACIYNKSYKL
jgi:hypothetical protein